MQATKKLHKCVSRCSRDCPHKWYAYSVEDEPIFTICEPCTEQMCIDEREQIKGFGGD